jgi:hypothetical protein
MTLRERAPNAVRRPFAVRQPHTLGAMAGRPFGPHVVTCRPAATMQAQHCMAFGGSMVPRSA